MTTKQHNKTYWEGHRSYGTDGATAECPYQMRSTGTTMSQHSRRQLWWNGYLDARSDDHLGHVFDKYNLGRMTDA